MRKGYWLTSIRRLRAKLAGGENAFVSRDGVFCILTLCADEETAFDDGAELRLAQDDQGNFLILEPRSARVCIDYRDGRRLQAGADLAAFIAALRRLAPPGLELGPVVDDTIDLPRSRRGVLADF
jgi:hypothetical protein